MTLNKIPYHQLDDIKIFVIKLSVKYVKSRHQRSLTKLNFKVRKIIAGCLYCKQ